MPTLESLKSKTKKTKEKAGKKMNEHDVKTPRQCVAMWSVLLFSFFWCSFLGCTCVHACAMIHTGLIFYGAY